MEKIYIRDNVLVKNRINKKYSFITGKVVAISRRRLLKDYTLLVTIGKEDFFVHARRWHLVKEK